MRRIIAVDDAVLGRPDAVARIARQHRPQVDDERPRHRRRPDPFAGVACTKLRRSRCAGPVGLGRLVHGRLPALSEHLTNWLNHRTQRAEVEPQLTVADEADRVGKAFGDGLRRTRIVNAPKLIARPFTESLLEFTFGPIKCAVPADCRLDLDP